MLLAAGTLVAALGAACALIWAETSGPSARAMGLLLQFKTSTCSLAQVVDAIEAQQARSLETCRTFQGFRLRQTDGRFERWSTQLGDFWIPDRCTGALAEVVTEQQARIYGAAGEGVRPGDVVLDCGAHVGAFTRRALMDGAAKVVAIDIAPENLESLRRTFAAEAAAGRVVVYPKGVWNRDETLTLYETGDSIATSVATSQFRKPAGTARLTTIDAIVSELALPHVDFVKMDVEAAEIQALEGAAGPLRRYRPRLAIAGYHRAEDPVEIPRTVRRIEPAYGASVLQCRVWSDPVVPEAIGFEAR